MSREANVKIYCDGCPGPFRANMTVPLKQNARGLYDGRNLEHALRQAGWVRHDDQDLCKDHRPSGGII